MKRSLRNALLGTVAVCCILAALRASSLAIPSGSWQATANLSCARAGASASLLPDGRILVTGGQSANGPVASADFFNPDGSVSPAPPMVYPRAGHVSVTLQDGRVLVAGGNTAGGSATSTAEIFDPVANSWTSAGVGMTEARAGATAALLQDGRVLIAGGQNGALISSTIEIYDPSTGEFTVAGMMSSPRTEHAMAVLHDGRVLIVGGYNGTAPVASTDIFDPVAGTISAGPALSVARFGHSATTLLNGVVVVIGGNNGNTNAQQADVTPTEILDPTAATPAFATISATLATPREGHLALELPNNNSILILGGTSAGAEVASAELFAPQVSASGAWTYSFATAGTMTAARSAMAASSNQVNAPSTTMQRNGIVAVAGGNDANGNALDTTEAYGYPTVQTDQSDYAPGTTVTITGSGFQPGETVNLQLVESPLIDTPGPFTAVADSNGNFANTQFVPDAYDVNVRFYLTAAGATSGFMAQNTFTDGNATSVSGTVKNTAGVGITGATVTCSAGCNTTPAPSTTTVATGAYVFDKTTTKLTFNTNGPVTITLTASAPGFTSNSTSFIVNNGDTLSGKDITLSPAAPTVTTVTPNQGPTAGGTSVTITGTNFAGATAVNFGAIAGSSVTINGSGTQITATSPEEAVGTVDVTVTTPAGTSAKSAADEFTYLAPPTIAKAFSPTTIALNGTSTLTLTLTNPTSNALALTGVGVSDSFPAGMKVASTPGATNTCGGTLSAAAGTASISLTGGSVAASGSCSVSLNVTDTTSGVANNTTGTVTSANGGLGTTASASLTVASAPTISKAFGTNSIPFGGVTSLSFTISNPNTIGLSGVAFTDSLPSGLAVANPNSLSSTCDGSTTAVAGSGSISLSGGTVAASGSCTISLNVTGTAVGQQNNTTGTISSNESGTGTTSNTATLTVVKATPTVTWANPADITYGTALSGTQLDATFTWTVNGSPVAVGGTAIYTPAAGAVLGAGSAQTLSVSFTPTDTTDYNSANGSAQINVLKATPTVTWANPADITYGTALSGTQLDATFTWTVNGSPVAVVGTPAYTPAAGAVLSAGSAQTLSVSFTPTDTTDYNSTTGTAHINVLKATPVFSGLTSQTITVGTATIMVSGKLAAPTATPPDADSVTISINGTSVSQTVALSGGGFSATLNTSAIPVSATPYTISYSFPGDANFNAASDTSRSLTVEYGVCLLYDPTRSVKSGATYPLKLYLCDAANNDVSSSAIVVTATQIFMASSFSGAPEDSGNSNPDSNFRFDPTLGPSGGYIFNLQTKGLASGTYGFTFTATGDSQTHIVANGFGVK